MGHSIERAERIDPGSVLATILEVYEQIFRIDNGAWAASERQGRPQINAKIMNSLTERPF
jgi:hypothetical protein